MDQALSISFIYFPTTAFCFFTGLLVLGNDHRSRLLQIFFISCLSLALWSFTMGLSIAAPDLSTCLFWRRLGAFGWGPYFALILHLFILMTNNGHWLKRKFSLLLLYLPAVYSVLVYGILTDLAESTFDLVQTPMGWINIAGSTFWDYLYTAYYLSYSLLAIVIVYRWGRQAVRQEDRKSAQILIPAFVGVLLLGSLTEIVLNNLLEVKVLQLAPILMTIPIGLSFYCLKRYGFMKPIQNEGLSDAQGNISVATRMRLYQYLALGFFFSGFVSFVMTYFTGRKSLEEIFAFGGFLFLCGILLVSFQYLKLTSNVRDWLSGGVMGSAILVTNLSYSAADPLTGWMLPVALILITVLFGQKRLLASVGVATLISLVVVAVRATTVVVYFNWVDHLIRLIVLAVVLFFAFYINRTFNRVIQENQEKTGQQKLLSEINALFLKVSEQNVEKKMETMLGLCGDQFAAQHVLLLIVHEDGPHEGYQWFLEPQREALLKPLVYRYFELMPVSELFAMMPEQFRVIKNLPSSESAGTAALPTQWGITAQMIQPLGDAQEGFRGFLWFARFDREAVWKNDYQEFMTILHHSIIEIDRKLMVEKAITYQANYDGITGLMNRAYFTVRLNQAVSADLDIAVIFIDVDGFKTINDTFGHDVGDQILMVIGQRITNVLDKADFSARFGGDEFAVMVHQRRGLTSTIDKIQQEFLEPIRLNSRKLFLTLSIGIAQAPEDGERAEELMKHADLAMYHAKENGKNKAVFCSSELKAAQNREMALSNDLYQAIEQGQLSLHYQPQVDGRTGEIVGLEALARWYHPQLGMVSPGIFIPIAEKNGLINELGDWVLREACRQNKAWEMMGLGPMRISVNFSLIQFMAAGIVPRIAAAIQEFDLKPKTLVVEITESINVYDFTQIDQTVQDLKQLGIAISIDDFGTEYSSLDRLKNLPVDEIKIDKRFIDGLPKDVSSIGIIRAIIALAVIFDLELVAEGVETGEQLEFLLAAGCRVIQGYYFYPPLSAEAVGDLLRTIHEQRTV